MEKYLFHQPFPPVVEGQAHDQSLLVCLVQHDGIAMLVLQSQIIMLIFPHTVTKKESTTLTSHTVTYMTCRQFVGIWKVNSRGPGQGWPVQWLTCCS